MVMHARKTQRMNDGYFEKHQAHPYQNSKYGSSKAYGSSSDRYERIRDSPNGNYRSDSPDSQSPRDRDRSYQSKGSYLQKIREKERENRDYKMSRDKYSDCARSPKDKRSRESDHRTNNDRNDEKSILHPIKVSQNLTSRDRKPVHNNSVEKREERERIARVGDWSEHVSSSGKKYYYNCRTEVSQWEKPREWIERERDRFRSKERDRDRDSDRCYSRSGTRHDKHSNSRTLTGGSGASSGSGASNKDNAGRESATASRHWSSSSSRDDSDAPINKEFRSSSNRKHQDNDNSQSTQQDMDISPGDSTPTSEISYTTSSNQTTSIIDQAHTQHNTTTTIITSSSSSSSSLQQQIVQTNAMGIGPVLLANALPRLISHQSTMHIPSTPGRGGTGVGGGPDASPQTNILPMMPVSTSTVTLSNAPGPPLPPSSTVSCLSRIIAASQSTTSTIDSIALQRQTVTGDSVVHTSLSVDTNNHTGTVVEGPPTPTHSETPDCSKVVSVPVSSPPGNLSTLQGMSSSLQALRPQGPTITPSLANHYRDDLVNHVRGWPAEILEKQAQKLAEEAHIMGSIQCSKVSAELKSARSIVRLTEIQATLQEQRILFLRQQIKELEELKSQNSFMSDDS